MPEHFPVATFAAGAFAGVCVAGVTAYAMSKAGQSRSRPSDDRKFDNATASQASRSPAVQPVEERSPVVQPAEEEPTPNPEDRPDDAPEDCVGVSSEQAGKAASCSGCPNQKLCASGEAKKPDPAVSDVAERLSNVKRKILVLSGKGGVGKSTISSQLSFGFAGREMDVGLLDVDITGPSVPRMCGGLGQDVHQSGDGWQPVYVSDRLAVMSIGFMLPNQDDAIIWRGPRKNGLIKQFLTDVNWGPLDALFIDTPPGTSDEHLSIVTYLQEASLDGAVIVTTPQEVSLMDVRKEINFCKKVNLPVIGVVENMSGFVCPNCGHEELIFAPTTGGAEAMCTSMGVPFLGRVPMDGRVAKAGDSGLSLSQLYPDGPVAKALHQAIDKADELDLEMAIERARLAEVSVVDITKGEDKLRDLRSMTPEQKSAKAAAELETKNKKEAYLLIKKDDTEALRALLDGLDSSVRWKDWRDYAGRTLWKCAVDLRARRQQEFLAPLFGQRLPEDPSRPRRSVDQRDQPPSPELRPSVTSLPRLSSTSGEKVSIGRVSVHSYSPKASERIPSRQVSLEVEQGDGTPLAAPGSPVGPVFCSLAREDTVNPDSCMSPGTMSPSRIYEDGDPETAELRQKALRAVAQDDIYMLEEVLGVVHKDVWERWQNKAGKDLLTLSQERGSNAAYSLLARSLGILKELQREAFEEREAVWVFENGEVQPRRATVLEDTPPEAEMVYVEFWDGDEPAQHVERCQVRKIN